MFFTNRPKGGGDTGTRLRKRLKQFKIDADSFDKKLKTLKTDIKQTKSQVKSFVPPQPQPEPKTKTKTKTKSDRRLQRVRIAAKKTKRVGVKTAKYLKKNPFATLVGASMAKDTFFPVALPKPPTVQGGKVGRRTAG